MRRLNLDSTFVNSVKLSNIMGQYASAYLAYGFELPEEFPEVFDDNDSFDNGVQIVPFGYDYSGKFIAIKAFQAYWEGPVKIEGLPLEVGPYQLQALKDFCEEYGLEYKEPSWNLLAHYS